MTVIAGTLRPGSQGLLTAGCLAVTPVVAYAAVVSPLLTLLLAAAAILVVATMANLTYGLAIFTTLTFFERLPSLPGSGAAKPMGFVLVVSWLLVLWRSRGQRPFLPRDRRALGFLVLAFVGWAAMSSLWALDAGAAAAGVVRLTLAVALFFVVYTALQTPRDLMTITWTFLTGAWVVSVLSIVTGANKAGRLEAGELDPNFLAATLIVAFTVALFLVWGAGRTRHHVLLVIFMVTYLYAVALTQSRADSWRAHSPWSEPSSSEAPSEAASRHPSWWSPRSRSATSCSSHRARSASGSRRRARRHESSAYRAGRSPPRSPRIIHSQASVGRTSRTLKTSTSRAGSTFLVRRSFAIHVCSATTRTSSF